MKLDRPTQRPSAVEKHHETVRIFFCHRRGTCDVMSSWNASKIQPTGLGLHRAGDPHASDLARLGESGDGSLIDHILCVVVGISEVIPSLLKLYLVNILR